jgi:hypothetical protein
MPSPLAHPAAAIPFTKVKLIFSALVFGSLSPDFGYLINWHSAFFMYTLPGLFLFDLPVGLALLWIYQTFAKWPLLSLLPAGLQRRLYDHARGFTYGPLKRFGLILLSLLAGSTTHIIWDSFTHEYGWIVEHFSFFKTPFFGMPLYSLLQDASSLAGIGLLIFWFLRWFPRAAQSEHIGPHFSIKVRALFAGLASICLVSVEGLIMYSRLIAGEAGPSWNFLYHRSIVFSGFAILGFFFGLYSIIWTIVFYRSIRQ